MNFSWIILLCVCAPVSLCVCVGHNVEDERPEPLHCSQDNARGHDPQTRYGPSTHKHTHAVLSYRSSGRGSGELELYLHCCVVMSS